MGEIVSGVFYRLEYEFNPINVRPSVSDDIQQTLARLMGLDEVNGVFRPIRTDQRGHLKTVPAGNGGGYSTFVQTPVDTTAVFALDERSNRVSWFIKNIGGTTIYLGFDAGVTTSNGFPIGPGESFGDDLYNGDVYAIGDAVGGSIFRLELESIQ